MDPRNGEIFYVGKGRKNRMKRHEPAAMRGDLSNPRKTQKILDINKDGFKTNYDVFAKDLNESDAFDVERDLIWEIGIENLTNHSSGVQTAKERAKVLLSRIKPQQLWMSERKVSWDDLDLYHHVKSCLEEIANG